jgi:hypothetical protein
MYIEEEDSLSLHSLSSSASEDTAPIVPELGFSSILSCNPQTGGLSVCYDHKLDVRREFRGLTHIKPRKWHNKYVFQRTYASFQVLHCGNSRVI